MLKKYTAIVFLTVAYAILLGHNIIPHHHHVHEHEVTAEHHSHEHHDHDDDENKADDLNHLFSHFLHSADGFPFTTTHNFTNSFSKLLASLVTDLPDNFALDDFDIPPLLFSPPAENLIYISPHSHLFGLRAPPAVLI